MSEVKVLKKNGNLVPFNPMAIVNAIEKSALRASVTLTDEQKMRVATLVENEIKDRVMPKVSVEQIHTLVEKYLEVVNPKVAKSYRDYRNYKNDFGNMMKRVHNKAETYLFQGDSEESKENSNKDGRQVSTQRALIASAFLSEMYVETFLTEEEKELHESGEIYIHDKDARLCGMNCCLFDMASVLEGGFEMGNIWYNEPQTLDTAFDVISDIVLSSASQQYGGFTIPQVDKVLEPYAKKSFDKYVDKYMNKCHMSKEDAEALAMEDVEREYEQGFQGWEYKFNTVASSRGDYPFITVTSGLGTSEFAVKGNIIMYNVHKNGQGKKGFKKPVLFPKYVFLYDKELHGKGKPLYNVYLAGKECSAKTMYPDWLSLTGEGYVSEMYKKYGKVVSPMGCRAFLSPWFKVGRLEENGERNHFYEAEDVEDEVIFEGRFNSGAISLNLPLIYLKAQVMGISFYEYLDSVLETIRGLHKRTKEYLGNLRASTNPLSFTQGGFIGGNLHFNQRLKESFELMDSTTYSFGITALNELQQAHNGKSITEDGGFALEVLKYINQRIESFKNEDHMLYAIYGTPAESLCGKQIEQLRTYVAKCADELKDCGYEIVIMNDGSSAIPNVCDKPYVSNSFHCHVSEDISPIEKQDLEFRFWNFCNGGKIQYVRYPLGYNEDAMDILIIRAMEMGFYEGCNLALSYCEECGHQELDMDVCPCCGSKNLTKIDRMNGYLSYSRVKGSTRLNKAKMAEIAERKSM